MLFFFSDDCLLSASILEYLCLPFFQRNNLLFNMSLNIANTLEKLTSLSSRYQNIRFSCKIISNIFSPTRLCLLIFQCIRCNTFTFVFACHSAGPKHCQLFDSIPFTISNWSWVCWEHLVQMLQGLSLIMNLYSNGVVKAAS